MPETTPEQGAKIEAGRIAYRLRGFVKDAESVLSGMEIEYLIQAAQFLENLSDR